MNVLIVVFVQQRHDSGTLLPGESFDRFHEGIVDFVLRFDYRISKDGNSGMQYRSFRTPEEGNPYRMSGYQADFDGHADYSGMIYGENFRWSIAERGYINRIEPGRVITTLLYTDSEMLKEVINIEDWNTYEIIAVLKTEAGGSRLPLTAENINDNLQCISMAGREVFKLAVNAMVESSQKVLADHNMSASDLRWVVPHQANARIIKAVAQRLEVTEEQVYMNVNRYGNTSSASIGLCLDEINRNGLVKPGDNVLLTSFGAGMTWGSLLIQW